MYNAITLREFLMSISPVSGEVHMILDHAKYDRANLLKEFLYANPHMILEFLHQYSSELNTIERVWKIIKSKGTHNRCFPSIAYLTMAVKGHFDKYSITYDVLKKLRTITSFVIFREITIYALRDS